MNYQQETPQSAKTQGTARNIATALLGNSFADVALIVPAGCEIGIAEAVLIAAHAIIVKLGAMEATHRQAMLDVQDGIDNLAASLDSLTESLDELDAKC